MLSGHSLFALRWAAKEAHALGRRRELLLRRLTRISRCTSKRQPERLSPGYEKP